MKPILTFIIALFVTHVSWSEPWVANRFAQNCAGCHAPGRYNRAPKDRRCSLSCQGCHVNPNGGGLRNEYGRWTSRRWLRSFKSKLAWSVDTPAPYKKQKYYHNAKTTNPSKKMKKKQKALILKRGLSLVTTKKVEVNEGHYDKYKEINNKIDGRNALNEKFVMPEGDPYRVRFKEPVTAGADFRYMFLRNTADNVPAALESLKWPMAFDVGVRVRPTKKHLSIVYETRASGGPNVGSDIEDLFTNGNLFTRSAYVLVDDLPYNTYLQYGKYRPLFGHYNPDHTSLFADMTGLDQRAVFDAVGIGTAPNVPFAMINILSGNDSPNVSSESGFVLTGGLRFVTLGASIQGSFWSTKDESGVNVVNKTMTNINGGIHYKRIVLNGDYTFIEREEDTVGKDSGGVFSVEAKYRFWREMYGIFNYQSSNVAPVQELQEGDGSQMQLGLKAFMLSGMELEALLFERESSRPGVQLEGKGYQLQVHMYF